MGCDIHTVAQVKKDKNWQTVASNIADEPRNYDVFAILANVRNGYGFAGCVTGEGFIPVDNPRGYPDDFEIDEDGYNYHVLPYVEKNEDDDHKKWMGDHSHSWLLLSEIISHLAVDRETIKKGMVDFEEFERLKTSENKWPQSWCGWTSNPKAVTYQWKIHYNEIDALQNIIEELKKIGEQHKVSDENVRLVFGFDS